MWETDVSHGPYLQALDVSSPIGTSFEILLREFVADHVNPASFSADDAVP